MPKLAESRNTRQLFIDSFFNNAQANGPTKTVGSDCSAAKQTCATFFSARNQLEGDKNPQVYNFNSDQQQHCERLNMKISKLKSRADCLKAAEKLTAAKNVGGKNSMCKFELDGGSSNLNVIGMLLEDNRSESMLRLVSCGRHLSSHRQDRAVDGQVGTVVLLPEASTKLQYCGYLEWNRPIDHNYIIIFMV